MVSFIPGSKYDIDSISKGIDRALKPVKQANWEQVVA